MIKINSSCIAFIEFAVSCEFTKNAITVENSIAGGMGLPQCMLGYTPLHTWAWTHTAGRHTHSRPRPGHPQAWAWTPLWALGMDTPRSWLEHTLCLDLDTPRPRPGHPPGLRLETPHWAWKDTSHPQVWA